MIFKAILDGTPTPAVRLNPDLPPKLEEIISKCLEKDRNLRYQHASEIRTDLQRLKRDTEPHKSTAAAVETALARRGGRAPWIFGAAALVIVAAVTGYFTLHRDTPKLSERDTIVLADFTNTTGDPVFDDTLKTALTVSLRQSPFLNVVRTGIELNMFALKRPPGRFSRRGVQIDFGDGVPFRVVEVATADSAGSLRDAVAVGVVHVS